MSDSLQHTRPPCPSPTPGVHSNSRPSSQWCHPAISSSVVPFSSCPQSLPASESMKVKSLSRVWLFASPWTVAYQAPPSMGFSRQECWSGLPFPSPGHLPNPGIEPGSPAFQADALPSEPPGKPIRVYNYTQILLLLQLYDISFVQFSKFLRKGNKVVMKLPDGKNHWRKLGVLK